MLLTILVSFGVGAFMGALVKCPHKASDAVDTIHKPRLTPLAITSHDLRLATFLDKKKAYLQSTQWRTKRSLALTRDGNACVICGISTHLNVHHLSYHQIPNEPIEELATLCEACHTHLHDTWGYPQTYEDYMNYRSPNVLHIREKQQCDPVLRQLLYANRCEGSS